LFILLKSILAETIISAHWLQINLQFTAPISSGSSGGALLDMFGRLVGLITAGFDKGQNLNLAVPSQIIFQFAVNFIEVN